MAEGADASIIKVVPHGGEFCDMLITDRNKFAIRDPSHMIAITIRELLKVFRGSMTVGQ